MTKSWRRVSGWSLKASRSTAGRLQQAVGERGKPERLLAVWKAELAKTEGSATSADVEPTVLPPVVAEEAVQARTALATNFDAVVAKLARTTEDMLKARYREDFERLASERARMDDELKTASESMGATDGALAEALTEVETLRARVAALERGGARPERTDPSPGHRGPGSRRKAVAGRRGRAERRSWSGRG